MTTTQNRTPAGVPTGGQFAASARAEADLELDDHLDRAPRDSEDRVDIKAAIEQGYITGFSTTPFDEPKTVSFHGHWEGSTIVVESIHDGDVPDERPETGYWDEGLWASSATGSSDAEIAAAMLDEHHDEAERIRVAVTDDDMTPDEDEYEYCDEPATTTDASGQPVCDDHEDESEETCVADDCGESLGDGEGFDGYCGTHADKIERHNQGTHRPVGGTDDEDEPTEGRDSDCPNCNGARVNWD